MYRSTFFQLPLEVREMIYERFFEVNAVDPTCEKTTIIDIKSQPVSSSHYVKHSWTAVDNFRTAQHKSATSLLLLSRQIRQEALQVYWRHRSLTFILDRSTGPFKKVYHIQERIAAICCVRDYLLRLAARHPVAISEMQRITLHILAFDHLDIAEMYDILSQTQKLLSNWRRNAQVLPFWLNLVDIFELAPQVDRPSTASVQPQQESTLIEFHLPIHDGSLWKSEVGKRMKSARLGFKRAQGEYDENWCNWCLDLLEWSLLNFEGGTQGCSLQRGCHCEKHIGRTQLARESGQLHGSPDTEVSSKFEAGNF